MVRESLRLLGMDSSRFNHPDWNPLGEVISPGQRVLIKPNFVLHYNAGGGPLEAVVTHASVLRAVADYVLIALQGSGELIIGDAPQMNCDWDTLLRSNGMEHLANFLVDACAALGIRFSVRDFREEQTFYRLGIVWKRRPLGRGPTQSIEVRLGHESSMEEIDTRLLYGADYDRSQTVRAHQNQGHAYRIAEEALASDVIVSVPKLKVHSKVGTTLNLKNMVGVNTDKNHLAHYRVGGKAAGGDEFSYPKWYDQVDRQLTDSLLGRHWTWGKYPFVVWRVMRKLLKSIQPASQRGFAYGNWHGNDTAWRMALDLNRIILSADRKGAIQGTQQRGYFSLIDGIVGGQGDGPLHPTPYPSGVILAGFNPVAVDWAATSLMGFDPSLIPLCSNGAQQMRCWVPGFTVDDIEICSNLVTLKNTLIGDRPIFQFSSAPGWRGHIERYPLQTENELTSAATDPLAE